MRRLLYTGLAVGAAGAALLLIPDSTPDAPPVPGLSPEHARPIPTQNWLAEGAEEANKKRRKAWAAFMHEQGPNGADWKTYEVANGLAELEKRNALATAPPSDAPGTWTERGSDNQAGRMHVAREDGELLYGGSSKGGVWKREGDTWVPLGDNLYGGAHWLEVTDGGALLAGTDGGLLHRSDDDGVTWWAPAGLPDLNRIRRLLKDQEGTLWLVAQSGEEHALYRSDDDGETFASVWEMGAIKGDIWASRTGDHALYLAADALYVSVDGENWEQRAALGHAKMELAGSEAGALYLVSNNDTLWRSDDDGATFASKHAVSDYWSSLNASTVDPDLVVWGGVEVYVSRDGGASFSTRNKWWEYYDSPADTLHADIPGLDVVPTDDGERWYVSTDGGLYVSEDGLLTVDNLALQGLRVSQYYDTLTSIHPPYHVAAGSQDQGYQITNRRGEPEGIYAFDQDISGDYAHLTSSDGSHDVLYSVYPGFMLVQVGEEDPWYSSADFPEGERYSWIPPIVADPDEPWAVFFCAKKLYRYVGESDGWRVEEWSEQSFETWENEHLAGLVYSELDHERMYATTTWGRVWHSEDKGRTWTQSINNVAYGQYLGGNAITASLSDVDTFYVGGNGYGVPAVYRSTDGGQTLEPWGQGLPDTLVYSLAEVRDGSGRVVAGTEQGAYMRGPDDAEWTDITGNVAPVTTYWSVEALHHEPTVRFGTYGRGIWDFTPAPIEGPLGETDEPEDTEPADVDEGPPRVDPEPRSGCGTSPVGGLALMGLLLWSRRR